MTEFEPEHLARLVELTDDLICIGGADGYFYRMSPSWTRVLGYTEEELRSRPFLEFVHAEDVAATAREVRRIFHGGRTREFSNRLRHRDGHYRWLRWNVAPATDAAFAYAVTRDITELQNATERLAAQTALLRETEQRRAGELAQARLVQEAFLPSGPLTAEAWTVAGWCLPAREMSGDFLDWYPLANGHIAIAVGDVMGKGVPAALLMSTTQTLLRALAEAQTAMPVEPAPHLERTNAALASSLGTARRFVTVFAGTLVPDGALLFADAGHGHAVIRRSDGAVEALEATGLPLGIDALARYSQERRQLHPGDVLLVATDGLRDVLESTGDERWTTYLTNGVSDWSQAESIVSDIVLWAESATGGAGSSDDLTLLVAVYRGAPQVVARPEPSHRFSASLAPALEALAACEQAINAFLKAALVPAGARLELLVALHEILANVVVHAAPRGGIDVLVELRTLDDGFVVEVATQDDGAPFEPAPGSEGRTDRGRGLAISRALLDELDYVRENDVNWWVLQRRVAADATDGARVPRAMLNATLDGGAAWTR